MNSNGLTTEIKQISSRYLKAYPTKVTKINGLYYQLQLKLPVTIPDSISVTATISIDVYNQINVE
jgi:hypothetical protein